MRTRLLRWTAATIAAAGALDPACAVTRPAMPEISVIAARRLPDPALTGQVEHALAAGATTVRGPWLGAAAVVSVGHELPPAAARQPGVAFAVVPEPSAPFVSITSVDAPDPVAIEARAPVDVRVLALAARGGTLVVTLRDGGVVVDRVERDVTADDETLRVTLDWTPVGAGPADITIAAGVEGTQPAQVRRHVAVTEARRSILVFDARPSWMSTFVRRALETDPRFVVTSRVATSRDAAARAGQPPATVATPGALEAYDAVIVGAPEELSGRDAAGLDMYLRAHGGAVVLILDRASTGRPWQQLVGPDRWTESVLATPAGRPLASEFFAPAALPPWLEPVSLPEDGHGTGAPTALWRTAVGRGRLIVSGALDAWRFRDRHPADFDNVWRFVVASAAAAASAGEAHPYVDVPAHQRPMPDDRRLLAAWTASSRGRVVPESRLADLGPAIARAIGIGPERRLIHPMRSAWWVVPFALALGGEWWIRRRRGER